MIVGLVRQLGRDLRWRMAENSRSRRSAREIGFIFDSLEDVVIECGSTYKKQRGGTRRLKSV